MLYRGANVINMFDIHSEDGTTIIPKNTRGEVLGKSIAKSDRRYGNPDCIIVQFRTINGSYNFDMLPSHVMIIDQSNNPSLFSFKELKMNPEGYVFVKVTPVAYPFINDWSNKQCKDVYKRLVLKNGRYEANMGDYVVSMSKEKRDELAHMIAANA